MKYSAKTKPGMGDPYWYEWSVGQQYIIDMLNPDNNIKCVELQANVKLGLDDVVVTYESGEKLFIQVKHALLITPHHWSENNGVLINQVDGFQKLGEEVQKSKIKELLEMGVSDDHMVIAGTVVDYTYKQELLAFMLTYLNVPGMKPRI